MTKIKFTFTRQDNFYFPRLICNLCVTLCKRGEVGTYVIRSPDDHCKTQVTKSFRRNDQAIKHTLFADQNVDSGCKCFNRRRISDYPLTNQKQGSCLDDVAR